MTPDELVEKMVKKFDKTAPYNTAEDMLLIVLQEIKDGEVVEELNVMDESTGVWGTRIVLKPEYQEWMEKH